MNTLVYSQVANIYRLVSAAWPIACECPGKFRLLSLKVWPCVCIEDHGQKWEDDNGEATLDQVQDGHEEDGVRRGMVLE